MCFISNCNKTKFNRRMHENWSCSDLSSCVATTVMSSIKLSVSYRLCSIFTYMFVRYCIFCMNLAGLGPLHPMTLRSNTWLRALTFVSPTPSLQPLKPRCLGGARMSVKEIEWVCRPWILSFVPFCAFGRAKWSIKRRGIMQFGVCLGGVG